MLSEHPVTKALSFNPGVDPVEVSRIYRNHGLFAAREMRRRSGFIERDKQTFTNIEDDLTERI